MFDANEIKKQFPLLCANEPTLVYLDSAATTQKPQVVIDALTHYYSALNANVHRGNHRLTSNATRLFESARQTIADFIGAKQAQEIIWTRGTTESINLIAHSYARHILQPGDEILISEMEHHANIVPWQMIAEQTGAHIVKIPMTDQCQFDLDAFQSLLSHQTKIVSLAQITNVTGSHQPIKVVTQLAHKVGAIVVVDGAQGIVHERIDVHELDIDFYVFSGHKLYAPNGIGIVYGKQTLLDNMPPWQGGGKMVDKVSFEHTTYSSLPNKFEAGTPNIAGAIALAKAIEWYQQFDPYDIESHLHHLQHMTYQALCSFESVRVVGYQPQASLLSFLVNGIHDQDIATLLDQQGIAVRAGHHCAHPLMDRLGLTGTIRVSFGVYNTEQDVCAFIAALSNALDILE